MPKAIGIHSGDVTHHQDQLIVSVNFSTKNTMKRITSNPTPPLTFTLLIFIVFYIIKIQSITQTIADAMNPNTKGIHNGEVTHTQDKLRTPNNFRIRRITKIVINITLLF